MARREERRFWISYGSRLGRNLYQLRTMRGLSQERLAELAGISRNIISNIERNENNGKPGDPVLSTVYLLARALHVPPAVLLPGGDQIVHEICRAEGPQMDLVWPARPEDSLPFDAHHLHEGKPGDTPAFAHHPPQSLEELGREILGPPTEVEPESLPDPDLQAGQSGD